MITKAERIELVRAELRREHQHFIHVVGCLLTLNDADARRVMQNWEDTATSAMRAWALAAELEGLEAKP
jgi:hypothetical protein